MKNRPYPLNRPEKVIKLTKVTKVTKGFLPVMILLSSLFGPRVAHAQWSIIGNSCVMPGSFVGPYTISGGTWSTADKWCVTGGGSTLGGTTNICIANNGTPSVGVTWGTGVTTATLSYYSPGTATTPVATLTVNIISPGQMTPGAVFVPTGQQTTINITGPVGSGCGTGTWNYQWFTGTNPTLPGTAIGTNSPNLTYTSTWTSSSLIWRVLSNSAMAGSAQSNPVSVIPETPFTPGVVTPGGQNIASGATAGTLSATVSTNGAFGPTYNYQWQQSTDNVNWTNAGSSSTTDPTYSPGVLTCGATPVINYYRQAVTTGPLTMYTNVVTVTVYPPLAAGSVSPAISYAGFNGSPGPLTITGVGGCCGSYSYQWQSSPDNSAWTNVGTAGPGSTSYTPTNDVIPKTYYRVLVTGGNSVTLASASGLVNMLNGVPAADNQTGNPNITMNWILSSGYDASGNVLSQEKKFYDQTGHLLQTQDKVFYRSNPTTVYTHVLATQPINDAYGRPVASTLEAPIDYADFNFISNFAQAPDGSNYTYKNFDLFNPSGTQTDKTNSPDPIGGQRNIGTLAWYYGSSNFWEPFTPMTNYPYSRETIYKDGTNTQKKHTLAGDPLVMGSGHEVSGYVAPVIGEFSPYIAVRNKFFTSTQIGTLAPYLLNNAIITTAKDQNGNEVYNMTDKSGKVLMSARPGNDVTITANAGIAAPGSGGYNAFVQGTDHINVVPSSQPVTVTSGSTVVYAGAASGFNMTTLGTTTGQVTCALPFTYQRCPSSGCSTLTWAEQNAPMTYFKIMADNTPVSISGGSYILYDMNTEAPVSLVGGNSLNRGYYKVVATSGIVSVNYSVSLTDVSYNFYDQLGHLIATIAPMGVKLLYGTGINNYSTLASIPYVSTYNFDPQGRLVSSTRPDGGTTQFVYRKDGRIRFSQNAIQAATGAFSYSNYDPQGRVIETGQYQPDANGIVFNSAAMTGILENMSSTGGLTTGTKTDVSMRVYDIPDNTHNQTGYTQDAANLSGYLSTTKRYSSIVNNVPSATGLIDQTWFSYDEEGKTLWVIRYNPALSASGYKTWDYAYDALDHLITKTFQKNTAAETFVHHFVYDPANGSLWKVYTCTTTSTNMTTWVLQANYIYYLHGPLKRVELGTNLQGIDYTYTLQGALKAINNNNKNADPGGDGTANGFMPDQFGTVLDYFSGDYNNTRLGVQVINGVNASAIAPDSYNGVIKASSWYTEKPSGSSLTDAPLAYVYNYDPKYQLINSTWGTNLNLSTTPNTPATFTTTGNNKESVTVPGSGTPGTPAYDLNGNILNLQRTNASGTVTDQFAYSYPTTSNQLQTVVNNASGTPVTYASYTYDALGRLTFENLGSATQNKYIRYNTSGKVTMIARDAAFTQPVVQFVYDEMGIRIEKLTYNASFQLSQVTYYYGDVIYTQTVTAGVYGTLTPAEYQIQGGSNRIGVYHPQSSVYEYELDDQQGNVRTVVAVNGTTHQETIFNDYYPYGMIVQNAPGDLRYDYQGQNSEKDGETGWNNFSLRMYSPRIGKWMTADPKGQAWSPYAAMGNSPVNGVDPDGGFYQELINFFQYGMWISNDALSEYQALQYAGLNPTYDWYGSRVKGYGVVSWVQSVPTDNPQTPATVIDAIRFDAVQDEIFKINGQLFAIYPDLQLKVTGGARAAFKLPFNLGGADINLFSVDLVRYSFANNKLVAIWNPDDWEQLKVSAGAEADLDGLKAGIGVSYGDGKLEVSASLAAGMLSLELTKDLMDKEASTQMNVGLGSDFKAGLGIVFESKLVIIEQPIPSNDVQAWINKQ